MKNKNKKLTAVCACALSLFLTSCGGTTSTDDSSSDSLTSNSVEEKWIVQWTWYGYETAIAEFTSVDNPNETAEKMATSIINEVTTEPTCEEEGVRTYTAFVEFENKVYTDEKYESIEATGHIYDNSGHCTVCNDYKATEGLEYSYDSSTKSYTLTGKGDAVGTSICIPRTYNDGTNGEHSVTAIAESAFENSYAFGYITIPTSITSIGSSAFLGCSLLRYVYYEGTLSEWLKLSFPDYGANPLNNGAALYFNGELAEDITMESTTHIESYAFYGCTSLKNVTIGTKVIQIRSQAFKGCTSIKNVYYEGSASQWADIFFAGNYANPLNNGAKLYLNGELAENITIENIATIEGWSFYGCSSLKSVTIGNYVSAIEYYAFENCTSLESVTVGNDVTSIEMNAFENCTSLTNITLGSNVTDIGTYVFQYCSSLESITIPASVTSIGRYSFRDCSSLSTMTFEYIYGWYRSTSSDATTGTNMDLSDPSANAKYFKTTYYSYYWFRS